MAFSLGNAADYGRIRRCTVRENLGNEGSGIALLDNGNKFQHDVRVSDCVISGNGPLGGSSSGGGMRLHAAGLVENCVVTNNTGANGAGVDMTDLVGGVVPVLRVIRDQRRVCRTRQQTRI